MRQVLQWIKNNPILIAAAVLCIAALVMLLVVHVQGEAFVAQMKERGRIINEIANLQKTDVTMPSEDIDGKPKTEQKTVNPKIIKTVKDVYGELDGQYRDIFDEAVAINQFGSNPRWAHNPMTEGLFPDSDKAANLFDARERYKEAFAEMLKKHTETSLYPRLDAGGPLDLSVLSQVEVDVERRFLERDLVPRDISTLSNKEWDELDALVMRRKIEEFELHANRIHIYAGTDPKSWPFELGSWCYDENPPTLAQAWEGQMSLWLQQDIVHAIARTNQVSDPNASVLTAPVKQLISIEVGNSYVGLTLRQVGSAAGAGAARGMPGGRGAATSGPGGRAGGGMSLKGKPFLLSPTGRVSNDVYDVRFVRVVAIVDWKLIGDFINNLAHTNLMTVLDVDIVDVDEYEALGQGYLYGTGDVVEATFVIETLWLRQWTTMLMPETVKQSMGIKTSTPKKKTGDASKTAGRQPG